MMNDRARLWSKRKSAPFADPRDEERALREMRKSVDHSFNINFKGEQLYMDNYRATVSFGAGCWQNTGARRRADVPQQERPRSILVSRQGLHSGLAVLVVAVCLFVMGVFWLSLQSQIQNVSTQIGVRTTNITVKQQENATLQAQISVATKEQSLLQRAQKLGMKEGKNVQVVELSGVPDAICGLQEGAQNTMTTTDGAADAHAVIESEIHSNKPQKRESGGRTCIRNCWYASESG